MQAARGWEKITYKIVYNGELRMCLIESNQKHVDCGVGIFDMGSEE